ncbi:MAG TPA: ImmA/IrrE family metallo-endopeptidase [Verrucomicrobiae bacterium]|nr:ImmA/IrrE family metallo-endopeptidase [Verrucomicrobiae bacterium]
MKWLSDPTRRFIERPHFLESEIQQRLDSALTRCFSGAPSFPLTDNELDLLVDSVTEHYDPMADLHSHLGIDVEGVTVFRPGHRPRVKISSHLLVDNLRRRRRMTIAHEVGHVLLHCDLYQEDRTLDLFSDTNARGRIFCKTSTMLPGADWMEWQASFTAGCLLMPSAAMRQVMLTLRGDALQQPLYLDDSFTIDVITDVARAFDVSEDAAKVRLIQTGFVEPHRAIQRLPLWE